MFLFFHLTIFLFLYFFAINHFVLKMINESSWSKHVLPPMLSHKDRLYLKMNQVD